MTINFIKDGSALSLPQDLIWSDELTWSAVAQAKERGIWGTLIVDAMARNGGQPITLTGADGQPIRLTPGRTWVEFTDGATAAPMSPEVAASMLAG